MSDSGESISRPSTPVTALPDTAKPYRFTWDRAESVSGTTTDGRADYFATRLGELPLNGSSTSLVLPNEWSSSKHGFYAISTVLNNPHKRQAPPKAHSALPSVQPADLPRVKRKDFDSYLRAITPEYERFQRGPESTDAGPSSQSAAKAIPPLDSVPPIFFESDFNFGNPQTFAVVTEQHLNIAGYDPTSLSHSLPLLEKFSHYADTIEQHLTHEISLRSSSFFAALTNLHLLQSESASCLSQITRLRKLLEEVDGDVAKTGLEVVRMERKIVHLEKVKSGVTGVKGMVELTGTARGKVEAGNYGEALGLVEELEGMWAGPAKDLHRSTSNASGGGLSPTLEEEEPSAAKHKPKPSLPVPLASLKAFSALPNHLRSLTMEIASSLSSDLVSVLREDLRDRIANGSVGGAKGKMRANEGFKEHLSPLLQGLLRTKGLKEATLSWREIVLNEIRSLVGSRFPDFELEADGGGQHTNGNGVSSSVNRRRPDLANHLRAMSHSEFITAMRQIYQSLLNAIEGLQAQGTIIGEVLESIHRLSSSRPDPSVQNELTDIVSSAAELSHAQAAKVISPRSELHSALQLSDFVELFYESWDFVVKGEVICRRMIVGLRGVIVGQAKLFLQAFHQSRLTQSAKLVEDEQWSPQEVSAALQRTTDILVDAAMKDIPELNLRSASITTPSSNMSPSAANGSLAHPPPPSPAASSPSAPSHPTHRGPSKHLRIEDRAYYTVLATSEVLSLLLDYLKVIVNLGMLTTDTMSRVIEFLKAFNSRTCQVVLGAGAMRSAGLKNITAKHLALASQSLSIMIALIPYVRETFRRHLSAKQAVMLVEFDKLKRDYQEHQNEIHAKLIAIMGDRLSAHIKTLQAVDWNVPKPNGGVNDYIELLVKETVTLHKVLSRYLSAAVVEDVMAQVFASINHRLSEEYTKIELPHAEAKSRLLADAKFLHQKLSALKNVGAPSTMLEIVISEKSIPRKNLSRSNTSATESPKSPPISAGGVNIASSASANQRLKGLLSGRSATFDKALPTPKPTSSPSPTLPPKAPATPPVMNSPPLSNGIHGDVNGDASPQPPPPPSKDRAETAPLSSEPGFKQVAFSESALEVTTEPSAKPDVVEPASSAPPDSPPSSEGPAAKEESSTPAVTISPNPENLDEITSPALESRTPSASNLVESDGIIGVRKEPEPSPPTAPNVPVPETTPPTNGIDG